MFLSQQYSLFPNPNDGSFTLKQLVPDAQPVRVEIWNAIGMDVYKNDLYFMGGRDKLQIANTAPGLYLLRLTDSRNRQFTFKFVKE